MTGWPFPRVPSPGALREDDERDIREEIELYLDLRTEELVASGMDPETARREARERFGDPAAVARRLHREARRRRRGHGRWTMGWLRQDLVHALRGLARARGFTVVAALTLAVALAGNTTAFAVLEAAVLRALPFPGHERLVFVDGYQLQDGERAIRGASVPEFLDWRASARRIRPLVAFASSSVTLSTSGVGAAERVPSETVSASYFDLLGARVQLGRTFTVEEYETPDGHPVAVLSHALWQRRFEGDPGVVGRTFELNERRVSVVGVLEPGFTGIALDTEVWLPLGMIGLTAGSSEILESRGSRFLSVVGRLAPGTDLPAAQAELDDVARELQGSYPDVHRDRFALVSTMREGYLGATGRLLWILFGAGALLSLIAAANVANLLLARSHARTGELVVRRALGADRGRLASQLLTESLALAGLGAAGGLALAAGALRILPVVLPEGTLPAFVTPSLSPGVFGFTLAVLVVVGLASGLVPAVRAGRSRGLAFELRAARTGGPSAAQAGFVVTQVGLALFLLVGAGLLARSFRAQLAVDPGLEMDGVHVFRVQPPSARYPDADALRTYVDEVLRRVGEMPGVAGVSASSDFPFRGMSSGSFVARDDAPEDLIRYHRHSVTPGYFENLGVRLLSGRFLQASDDRASARVAVVTEAFVRRVFPEEPTGIGRTFWTGNPADPANLAEIVGVVENVRYRDLTQDMMAGPNSPDVFFSMAQVPVRTLEVSYRVEGNPTTVAAGVRAAMRALDRDVPLYDEERLVDAYLDQTATPRFAALLMSFFGAVALALAAVGIYGVLSFVVGRQTREIAVRRALGARAGTVASSVVARALRLAALGCAIGGGLALLGARALERFLFGVEVTDAPTLVSTMIVMMTVATVAAAIPAWRASRCSPVKALAELP